MFITCDSLISSVKSQAPLGAMFICDNLVRNICYGSEYFAFFNGQAGVTCKGFHPLANVKIWLRLDITQHTLSWLLVGTPLHVAKLKKKKKDIWPKIGTMYFCRGRSFVAVILSTLLTEAFLYHSNFNASIYSSLCGFVLSMCTVVNGKIL